MLKQTARYVAPAALAAFLSACSWFSQPAAPVVAGTESGSYGSAVPTANPYGATPYNPNAEAAPAPYVPAVPYTPPAPAYTPPSAGTSGTYVPSYAPVDIHAATHTVVRGDTVYNISKRYNISQDNLREWNNLNGNNIGVGQVLRVKPAGYAVPKTSGSVVPVTKPVVTAPVQTAGTPVRPGAVRTVAGITWQRPADGSLITRFGGSSKGVDIAGNAGQPVSAAADGKVVYAGSGLRGYGNLVIVQHNANFLTAYGHNQSLVVKEGQSVKRGQIIARMGSSDADRTKLHFEVRKDGKPVNPADYVVF
ncbi:MAG: peptidoglycan DD-metalloendopeptidase family protein [Neisseria sp.]|nr:peptidoglycan DD-metalloendopeptidase family protein [Neisseria sp.]